MNAAVREEAGQKLFEQQPPSGASLMLTNLEAVICDKWRTAAAAPLLVLTTATHRPHKADSQNQKETSKHLFSPSVCLHLTNYRLAFAVGFNMFCHETILRSAPLFIRSD